MIICLYYIYLFIYVYVFLRIGSRLQVIYADMGALKIGRVSQGLVAGQAEAPLGTRVDCEFCAKAQSTRSDQRQIEFWKNKKHVEWCGERHSFAGAKEEEAGVSVTLSDPSKMRGFHEISICRKSVAFQITGAAFVFYRAAVRSTSSSS